MTPIRSAWLATVTATLLSLPACSRDTADADSHSALLERNQGLEISRTAARQYGYDLGNYELDTFGDSISGDGRAWLFLYRARPHDGGSGRHFLVAVDRRSRQVEIFRGE